MRKVIPTTSAAPENKETKAMDGAKAATASSMAKAKQSESPRKSEGAKKSERGKKSKKEKSEEPKKSDPAKQSESPKGSESPKVAAKDAPKASELLSRQSVDTKSPRTSVAVAKSLASVDVKLETASKRQEVAKSVDIEAVTTARPMEKAEEDEEESSESEQDAAPKTATDSMAMPTNYVPPQLKIGMDALQSAAASAAPPMLVKKEKKAKRSKSKRKSSGKKGGKKFGKVFVVKMADRRDSCRGSSSGKRSKRDSSGSSKWKDHASEACDVDVEAAKPRRTKQICIGIAIGLVITATLVGVVLLGVFLGRKSVPPLTTVSQTTTRFVG